MNPAPIPREGTMYRFLELHVADFMTDAVVTTTPETTIAEAQAVFEKHDFNCLPVVHRGRLVGVLTKLDVLKGFRFRRNRVVPPYSSIVADPVRRVMSEQPAVVDPDAPLTRVLERMVKTRFRSFPVTRGDSLVGIISREDVLRALLHAAEATPAAAPHRRGPGRNDLLGLVGHRLGCDARQAAGIVTAVFHELRDRLTAKEAADVAAQLPAPLRRIWKEDDAPARSVRRTRLPEFLLRVRKRAGLRDECEAERATRAVFHSLQRTLGSASGWDGESWDVFSQLPKDLKKLWLAAGVERDD
jgi:CBS domain-containing protein/uncharacterized protein (DUF2267 family)